MRAARWNKRVQEARSQAAGYETTLEPTRRKRLGQYFSGLSLGRLLAAIALDRGAKSVIDPMAGHGDLLDATIERAVRRGQLLARIDGVELDLATEHACNERLSAWKTAIPQATLTIRASDAFDPGSSPQYLEDGYDLVITNPPYVRYQSQAVSGGAEHLATPDQIRRNLAAIVSARVSADEWPIWRTLINGYSGLADLSVPSWILCAALVRAGGVLALVAPATWQTRDYGDVIHYLVARCFQPECFVEDTQPGWFSNALVRTQLVIARRRKPSLASVPLSSQVSDPAPTISVRVAPSAAAGGSLVGAAFNGNDPEHDFARWLSSETESTELPLGISRQVERAGAFAEASLSLAQRKRWFHELECFGAPAFSDRRASLGLIPPSIKRLLSDDRLGSVILPSDAGLRISQGLRTGCNAFFYVDLVDDGSAEVLRVRVSAFLGNEEISVPAAVLRPAIRRQSEALDFRSGKPLRARVLDLNGWFLPEDAEVLRRHGGALLWNGIETRIIPDELAAFVRRAGNTIYGSGHRAIMIRELSAVRTNVRPEGSGLPRCWYMLPPFARRHRPDAYVARVNQGIPRVHGNCVPPILIDANFSTIWSDATLWTPSAIQAVFNTSWCRACMEALGTPLGGGALKLEATHLRRLPLPVLDADDLTVLDAKGRAPTDAETIDAVERLIVGKVIGRAPSSPVTSQLIRGLTTSAESMSGGRQRRPR